MSDAKIKDANRYATKEDPQRIAPARGKRPERAIIGDNPVRATRTLASRPIGGDFSAERRKHETPDAGGSLFPRRARALEGEAHPGLEAIQGVRGGLEQRSPAERRADFLVENRLRRLPGRINADEASRIG